MKHLLKLLDCTPEEITSILDLADQLKYERKHHISHRLLEGKSIGLIFQKSSTRTRVSFAPATYRSDAVSRYRIPHAYSPVIWTAS